MESLKIPVKPLLEESLRRALKLSWKKRDASGSRGRRVLFHGASAAIEVCNPIGQVAEGRLIYGATFNLSQINAKLFDSPSDDRLPEGGNMRGPHFPTRGPTSDRPLLCR